MSNNEPDYKDNLVFEPEMTWEDLRAWANSKGLYVEDDEIILLNNNGRYAFWEDGEIWFGKSEMGQNSRLTIAENRTPKQMKSIMIGLE